MSRQRIGEVAEILLNYFERNKTFQTDNIMTVPASAYTEAGQWQAEIDLIFKRVPLMLALSCEMPKPGDYKAMEVVGVPVLIARDKQGKVRAFCNVCAHRWAPVASEGLGSCPHFRFICPFHGWTYGADGKLLGIADRAKFGDIDRSTHGLKELPCEERHGMIFVSLTPGTALDLTGYYGALLEEYSDLGMREWTFLGSNTVKGPNWKLILTNFSESYHIAAQHPKTLAPSYVANLNHYEGFGPNMRVGTAARSIGELREVPRAQWEQQEGRHFLCARYFFPNVTGVLSLEGTGVFTQIFPGPTLDASRVVVLHASKMPLGNEGDREKAEKELKDRINMENEILLNEDFATGIATQKGLKSGAYEGLLYGKNERGPQYFHEWLDWYLQGDPTLPRPVM